MSLYPTPLSPKKTIEKHGLIPAPLSSKGVSSSVASSPARNPTHQIADPASSTGQTITPPVGYRGNIESHVSSQTREAPSERVPNVSQPEQTTPDSIPVVLSNVGRTYNRGPSSSFTHSLSNKPSQSKMSEPQSGWPQTASSSLRALWTNPSEDKIPPRIKKEDDSDDGYSDYSDSES
ncbi:hypothetical protein NMY22_g3660 [Coprinellus aureogranulatus]|nr:hypothetical protein NMY22_g3660 [Coprinellus aureogranulatus]